MKKSLKIGFFGFVLSVFLTACGGGGGDNPSGDIDNVVVDPQAYYVDAIDGNDNNDGKTPQSAWRSLDKLNSITINAGNKILFRVGQKWQGQLNIKNSGTAENPIIIGSYGDGAQPVISAVGPLPQVEWKRYSESDISKTVLGNVQDQDKTWVAITLPDDPDRLRIDGKEMLKAYIPDEIDQTFNWYYNADTGAVLYIYSDTKPTGITTNLFTSPIFIKDQKYIKIENIELEGGYVAGIFLENSSDITITGVTVGDMSKQGIYVKSIDAVTKNILINNCTIDSKYTLDYSSAGIIDIDKEDGKTTTTRSASEGVMFWGNVQNSSISQSLIKNWTHANINFSTNTDEELSFNKVYENTITAPDIAYGGRIGVDGKNNHNNKFYDNIIKDIKAPIQFNGHDNEFYNNIVEDVKESILKPDETGYGVVLQAYASAVYNNKVINNTFKNIAKEAVIISDNNTYEIKDNTITPNTIE